jgi:hypothetical protein
MAELSYPINPPIPDPPTPNPNPPSPSNPNPPADPEGDPCKLLQQANEDILPACDNVHFGTPKCEVDWVYFNNAPCGFGPKKYQNGIGYAGTYFRPFDDKGFFRIEGLMDADAGEPNLYSYAGTNPAFEIYMYRDGLNIKGLQGAGEGSSETCHIKVFKGPQQTEIDFQGATNLSFEGAEIFKSQLYKQTIEGFVSKYDYNQEWVGLEANVNKSLAWGGLNQSDYYRLMYDNAGSKRAFLEILNGGYQTYAQLQVKDDKVNLYSQLNGSDTYFGIEAVGSKVEEVLYYNNSIVKLKSDQTEASTYNTYDAGMYASLVSKNSEGYVYLKGNGAGYSFLESKLGEARLFGTADGGQDYFDINTQGGTYLQVNNGQDYFYLAPKDIPKNSEPVKNYAGFDYLWFIDDVGAPTKEAIVSSGPIDIRHLGACWAKYPCKPVLTGPPCFADLTFGGNSNSYCRLSAFDVYVGSGPEFELYQYNYGMDLKPANNQNVRAAFYTDGSTTMNLDVNGTSSAYVNAKNGQGNLQAYAHFNSNYNGFALINNFNECYMTADGGYRYLVLNNDAAANWRTAAGTTSADTTIYTQGGSKQVAIGAANSQAYMQFYSNNGSNQMFGFADNQVVQWEGTIFGAYAQMKVNSAEGKFQTSKGSQYAQMFSDATACDLSLVSASRSTINASAGSANWSVTLSNGEANAYWQGGGGQVSINTDDCKSKYVYLREIDVCIDGEKKKMIILASDPY